MHREREGPMPGSPDARRRPVTPRRVRAGLAWLGFLLVALSRLGDARPAWSLALGSLGLLAWAAWAWLGPRVESRSAAAARWFQLLAALLVLLAAAPWVAWAWMAAS